MPPLNGARVTGPDQIGSAAIRPSMSGMTLQAHSVPGVARGVRCVSRLGQAGKPSPPKTPRFTAAAAFRCHCPTDMLL
jgi:hypothetical protein